MIIFKKYKILEKIGEGTFGNIYKAENIRTKEMVAVKVESIKNNIKLLKNESKIYNYIGKKEGIPELKWFGRDTINYYMVLNLLGNSLSYYKMNNCMDKEKMKDIFIQMITRISFIHSIGLIHRDIKPDNFVFDPNNKLLYLIDFGFAIDYNLTNNENSSIIGSVNYASLNILHKKSYKRADDLESALFIILYLLDKLDWISIDFSIQNIIILKENIVNNNNIPISLRNLFKYIRNLDMESELDYNYIINEIIYIV